MLFNQQPRTAAARLTAAVIGTAVTFVLFAAYMVFPPLGFFTALLAPFPVAFFRFGNGRGAAVIITIGVTTLMTSFFGIQSGMLFLLQCGVIALLMPELLLRGYGAARTIAWTTAVNLVVFALAALAFSVIGGQNIHLLAVREINASIAQTLSIYEQAGIKGDELALMRQSMTLAADVIIRIYPALLTVMLIVVTGCNLSLVKRFAGRLGLELEIGAFTDFRNREMLVWLLIASGFAMLAASPIIHIPALNVLVVVTTLYFLQGLAVLLTVIARQSYAGVLRVMLIIMLLFQPYLAALVAALGIFDLWGDFRTPRKQENL